MINQRQIMSKEKYLTREDYFFKLYLNKLQKFSKVEVKANQLTSLETMNSISNFDFSQYYSFDLRKLSFNLIHSENFKNFRDLCTNQRPSLATKSKLN